jgi:competence protein ComEA
MPPSPERRAVLLLLGLAVGGQAVRSWLTRPGGPPGDVRILPGSDTGLAAHRDSAAHADRPLGPKERIDLDRAPASEIARLPRIGLPLAKIIVADRDARGSFGSLEQLDRVAGIGPGLLKLIAEHVSFSGPTATPVPGPGAPPIDLNTATAAELERLPLIGPSLAARIVAHRERHGPFAAVEDLVQVPGIGPATLARLRDRVTAGR